MSISSEITRINQNIASAYTACNNKGATMPQTQNSSNLAATITSIPTGGGTLIPKTITENGTYAAEDDNADGYSEVTVNIQPYFSTTGTMYFEKMLIPYSVTSIKQCAYQGCTNMRKLEIAGTVKNIFSYAFQNTYITELILNNGVETIGDNTFGNHNCQTIALPNSIKTIGIAAFSSARVSNQIIDLSAFVDPNNLPTLNNSNAFTNIKVLQYEVANQEMLQAFETATNWSTYIGKYVIKEVAP